MHWIPEISFSSLMKMSWCILANCTVPMILYNTPCYFHTANTDGTMAFTRLNLNMNLYHLWNSMMTIIVMMRKLGYLDHQWKLMMMRKLGHLDHRWKLMMKRRKGTQVRPKT